MKGPQLLNILDPLMDSFCHSREGAESITQN